MGTHDSIRGTKDYMLVQGGYMGVQRNKWKYRAVIAVQEEL